MLSIKPLKIIYSLLFGGMLLNLVGCQRDKPFSSVNPPTQIITGLQHQIISSQYEKGNVGISVVLPRQYKENPHRHYKVIYYLHGWGGNESSDAASIQAFVRRTLNDGVEMPVIVYPNGGRSGYFGPTENMIIKELIPYIENNFRVLKTREGRALLGFSMGGTAALRLTLKYPQLFASATSLGGRLWENDASLLDAIESNHKEIKALETQLFFVQGEQDGPNQFQAVTSKLSALNIPFHTQQLTDTTHNLSTYLEKAADIYMR